MNTAPEYWSDIAARDYAWCIASPDGKGPHRPIPAAVPDRGMPDDYLTVECAECGQTTGVPMPDPATIDWG